MLSSALSRPLPGGLSPAISLAPAPAPVARLIPEAPPLRRGPVIPWTQGRSNTLSCDNPAVAACKCGATAALTPARPPLAGKDIDYTVSIPHPETGYLEVEMRVPVEGRNPLLLSMARWTPGHYEIQNYSRNVDDNVSATDDSGRALKISKADTTMWSVDPQGASSIVVRYRVHCHDKQYVSTNWVEPGLALINGAATFMTIAGDERNRGCNVTIDAPSFAGVPATSLGQTDKPNSFHAMSFDALVDAPIVLGITDRRDINVDGVKYTLATHGSDNVWDSAKAAKALAPVLAEIHKLWKVVPFDAYTFLNILGENYGGLEHLNSTVLMSTRWGMKGDDNPVRWLILACHELLHAWNVKRLRPKELGPFDYTRINGTPSLWVAEGLTEYYANLLVCRSGAMQAQQMLERISLAVGLASGHASTIQSLESSSLDSFIKFDHPNANSPNVEINYYVKGALVGIMLDIEIRKLTHGAKSLDDVMRLAYSRYSGERGYTPQEWEACASEVAGVDLKAWFDKMVRSTEQPPIAESLAKAGLRLKTPASSTDAYLGAETELDGHRTIVKTVSAESPAAKAGILPGDEIISIGDYRVRPGELDASMQHYKAGETYPMLVARHDKLVTLNLTFGMKPYRYAVELDPNAPADALALRKDWLGV